MEVSVWSSDWGLASVDPTCLSVLAYAKFSGAPVIVKTADNPYRSPTGRLPVFRDGLSNGYTQTPPLTDFHAIYSHLKQRRFSADYNLTPRQHTEVLAFGHLMEAKLSPALLYLMWVEPKNYLELTRPCYAAKMGFPLSLYYPNVYAARALEVVRSLTAEQEDGDMTAQEHILFGVAEECLELLSQRLGDEPYFFGRSPSSADALMYGYLALLLKAPFMTGSAIKHRLEAHDNLVSFVNRVTKDYFSPQPPRKTVKDQGFWAWWRKRRRLWEEGMPIDTPSSGEVGKRYDALHPLAATSFALAAMAGYAYSIGIYRSFIVVREEDEDEDNS